MDSEDVTRWPESTAREYRELGYWTDETLGGFLRERAREYGPRTAVRDHRAELTYTQLDAAADSTATRLHGLGVSKGDRVIVQIDNRVELYIVQFALFRIGGVPIFALPSHGQLEVEQFCQIAEPVMIISSSTPQVSEKERVAHLADLSGDSLRSRIMIGDADGLTDEAPDNVQLWPAFDPSECDDVPSVDDVPTSEDLAFLQLSGGSTGIPKLIPRTHADYLYSVRGSAVICELTEHDVMLVPLPAAHNYPYSSPGALGIWHAGGGVVLAKRPDPDACLSQMVETGTTIVPLVPAIAHMWLMAQEMEKRQYPRLRILQVGGAKLSRDVAQSLERAFDTTVQQVFGMAEGLVNYTRLDDDEETRVATQGLRISPHDEVKVVDDNGNDLPAGQSGHLLTRGPYTIRGYYRNPAANRSSFTPEGWYRTGDLVSVDDRGYITVTGRAKSVINRGGEKVAPEEIEFHLHADPRVLDAVVVGVPDEILGERTRATVVPREKGSMTSRDVRTWLRERGLASFKLPDQVRFADELERTAVGKNQRT